MEIGSDPFYTAELHDVISSVPGEAERRKNDFLWRLFREDFYLNTTGRGEELAQRKLEEVAGKSDEEILQEWMVAAVGYAYAFWQVGGLERAVGLFEALAFYPQQEWVSERAMDMPMALANLYDELGRQNDMLSVLERVVEHLEKEVNAGVRHPHVLRHLSDAYALRGDREAFLETLDLAVDYGYWDMHICCQDYWSDEQRRAFERDIPGWLDDYAGDPDFEIIRTRMRSTVDAQRANIQALFAANDMEQLFASSVVPYYLALEQEEASGN